MTDFEEIIRIFSEAGAECVIVGGLAAAIHGSARLTQDVDFVYARNRANLRRLVATLKPHSPYLRGAPPGLPFEWNEVTLERGLDFTLTTAIGDIDLLGEITGGGDYRARAAQRGGRDVRVPMPMSGPAGTDPHEARGRSSKRPRGACGDGGTPHGTGARRTGARIEEVTCPPPLPRDPALATPPGVDGGRGRRRCGCRLGAQEALRPLRRHGDAHLHVPFCPDTPDARC